MKDQEIISRLQCARKKLQDALPVVKKRAIALKKELYLRERIGNGADDKVVVCSDLRQRLAALEKAHPEIFD